MSLLERLSQEIISRQYSTSTFYKNETLFSEGDKLRGVYFVKSGNIKILKKGKKKDMVMWIAHPNDQIGIVSYYEDKNVYRFSAKAAIKSEVVFISLQEFDDLLKEFPAYNVELIKVLCSRLDYVEKRLNNIMTNSIKDRFVYTLQLLAGKYKAGTLNKFNEKISINYSLKDVSEILGTSEQYLKKIVKEFQQRGAIEVDKKRITINEPQILMRN